MARPSPPGNLRVQVLGTYKTAIDGQSTHRKHDVGIRADIRSQQDDGEEKGAPVRLVVEWSNSKDFKGTEGGTRRSDWGPTRKNVTVRLNNLTEDARYYIRARTQMRGVDRLSNPSTTNFYTEQRPLPPRQDAPAENASVTEGATLNFQWKHQDADTSPADPQRRYQLRWRQAGTLTEPPGEWDVVDRSNDDDSYSLDTDDLAANTHYEWQIRTKDTHSTFWSLWSTRSFYIKGTTSPPRLVEPIKNEAVGVSDGMTFHWVFRDPDAAAVQTQANLRFRVAGAFADPAAGWTLLVGTGDDPGGTESLFVPAGTIAEGYRYEWQVQTQDGVGLPFSSWSRSGFFYAIRNPGWAVDEQVSIPATVPQGSLGSGQYRVFAYDQGGQRYRGEITPISSLTWTRVRDDISSCNLRTSGFGEDCCALLSGLRSWAHEIVVFRDGERVWEGPITRPAWHRDTVEIEARDPMVYAYRAIMRQGYNDNFRRPRQGIVGSRSVVERAQIILQNALAPWDEQRNVLPYLTVIHYPDDARQSRIVPDWSKTAWEEVDDMAATAGLDYTCVGRRIILHDTHRPVGIIAEMRDKDFFESPIVTEYGLSAANIFGVTSNTGVYGKYEFKEEDWFGIGPIEMLASAYGEGANSAADPRTLTRTQREELTDRLNVQAARNINGRWATVHIDHQGTPDDADDVVIAGAVYGSPLVVRVPDNSRIHPEAYVGIQQLVPGVHIPLRMKTACREVAQVQKLDAVHVTWEKGEEKVQVTMSPAPIAGIDADQNNVDGVV